MRIRITDYSINIPDAYNLSTGHPLPAAQEGLRALINLLRAMYALDRTVIVSLSDYTEENPELTFNSLPNVLQIDP